MLARLSPLVLGLTAIAGAVSAATFTLPAAPSGVTYQPLGTPQGYGPQRMRQLPRDEVVYADAKGLTTYVYDGDGRDKSNCTGECASTWRPLVPVPGAAPVPGWTIIARSDGTKQWSHLGQPLYTYKGDKEGGDVLGLGAIDDARAGDDPNADAAPRRPPGPRGNAGRAPLDAAAAARQQGGRPGEEGAALTAKLPDGWHVRKLTAGGLAALPLKTPIGFEVKEVTDAGGIVLVDARDRVLRKLLYTFSGDLSADQRACDAKAKECLPFLPVEAPQLAQADIADWTIVERPDGLRQWAYKGLPLYSYDGDRVVGDVHGVDRDPRWQLAMTYRHYWPANINYRDEPTQGKILTTDKGMTLYRRDLDAFITIGTRVAHDYPYRPRVGRMTRNDPCLQSCEKNWKPYLAPADAIPSGYWGVNLLPNGKKQWTYKDFALFTYVGDKQPGDAFGNLIYETRLSDDPKVDNEVGFPSLYKSAFNWGVARF